MADPPRTTTDRHVVRGRVVTPAGVYDDGVVVIAAGRVSAVREARPSDGPPWPGLVLPGLVDIHNHGGGGASFTTADGAAVGRAARHHLDRGTTSVVASLVADRPEALLRAVAVAAEAVRDRRVAAIHLEGPFLAAGRCGAQDPRHLRVPDLGLARELVAAGGGHVRVMTFAPELPGASELADSLREQGVTPAVGHTEADAGTVRRTLAASAATGAPGLVTHLFNGMAPLHHRSPGAVAGALTAAATGHARVELVADGVHLHDDTVRMVLDLLGPGRVVLVTDAMAAAGMPDGAYDLGPRRVRVVDGVARLDPGTPGSPLAGGTAHLLDVVRRCVRAGLDLADVVTAASATPAAVLGLQHELGSLQPGLAADLLLVDEDLGLRRVMRAGEWVH